jgi:hypothetical protein
MLKTEKIMEIHIISIKNSDGALGQANKIAINTTDNKTILLFPKMFALTSDSLDLWNMETSAPIISIKIKNRRSHLCDSCKL